MDFGCASARVHVSGGRFNPMVGTYVLPFREGSYKVSAKWNDVTEKYDGYVSMNTIGGSEEYRHKLINYNAPMAYYDSGWYAWFYDSQRHDRVN